MFLVGLLNTLLVSALGIVFATILGFVVGIARLSSQLAAGAARRRLCRAHPQPAAAVPDPVLVSRGARARCRDRARASAIGLQPLVLVAARRLCMSGASRLADGIAQWWRGLAEWVGPPAIYLNNRGLIMPRADLRRGSGIVAAALLIAVWPRSACASGRGAGRTRPGRGFRCSWSLAGAARRLAAARACSRSARRSASSVPELRGFNFVGGVRRDPGIHRAADRARRPTPPPSSPRSCAPASWRCRRGRPRRPWRSACGAGPTLRLVVVPQALRVIIPPLTNQYLNLTKNSSLAVAIGYPDLVAVFAGTTLNQTGSGDRDHRHHHGGLSRDLARSPAC